MPSPELNFVMFYVSDLDASLSFFTDILGFERTTEWDGPGYRQLKGKGGITFGLILPAAANRGKPGDIEIYVGSDDIQATHEALISKGVAAGPVVEHPFGQISVLPAGPDGVKVVEWLPSALWLGQGMTES
jgi:catechol 2,3-dioxygenase-like lactoylglutathione lyase family enzyme